MSDAHSQRKVHYIGPSATVPREALPSYRLYCRQFIHRQLKQEHPPTHQCRLESFKQLEDDNQWPAFLLSFGVKETFASVAALNQKPHSDNEKLQVIMGSRGSGVAEFLFPRSLCFLSLNEDVVIADKENDRVQVFNYSGVFKAASGSESQENATLRSLQRPQRVASLPNNSIAVTDSVNCHVFVLQGKLPQVRYVIPTNGLPLALTCTSEKVDNWELFVLTDQDQIEGFSKTRKRQTLFPLTHSCTKRGHILPDITVDHPRHLLFISEPLLRRVFIYHISDGSGELIHSFGLIPCLSALSMQPAGLALLKSTMELVVADSLNHTVNAYSCVTGELTRCLLTPSDKLGGVVDIAVSPDQTLLAALECDLMGKHQAKVFQINPRPADGKSLNLDSD